MLAKFGLADQGRRSLLPPQADRRYHAARPGPLAAIGDEQVLPAGRTVSGGFNGCRSEPRREKLRAGRGRKIEVDPCSLTPVAGRRLRVKEQRVAKFGPVPLLARQRPVEKAIGLREPTAESLHHLVAHFIATGADGRSERGH